jgi:hypothetical protein
LDRLTRQYCGKTRSSFSFPNTIYLDEAGHTSLPLNWFHPEKKGDGIDQAELYGQ